MSRILAIDYGSKRVGLAVTDPLQIIATALETVSAQDIIPFLKKYFSTEQVERIIIGYPLNLDNSPTHATPLVEKFIQQLHKSFPSIPVEKADERFTSKMAMQSLVAANFKKKDRRKKENLDKVSAT